MRVPRSRVEEWLRVLSRVEELAGRLRARLGPVTLVLHGSYARGDFNLWSDVDVIIVSPAFEGLRVLDRYDPLLDLLPPGFEAIPMTPRELRRALEKPAWRQALARGYIIVADDLSLEPLLKRAAGPPRSLRELKRSLRELLAGTA
ncbi:MAG: nucleotidyltransferase domain-containing protein [Desulfurococcales archaeon]|nr:nucleotidyltransferase domain-containing protein [Desulfurococcales archaeon]